MKNIKLENIFIKNLLISGVIQLLFSVVALVVVYSVLKSNHLENEYKSLVINDQFTTESIIKYKTLENQNALDLLMLQLTNDNKLNDAKFVSDTNIFSFVEKNFLDFDCENVESSIFCKKDGELVVARLIELNGIKEGILVTRKSFNGFSSSSIGGVVIAVFLTLLGCLLINLIVIYRSAKGEIYSDIKHLLNFINNSGVSDKDIKISEFKHLAKQFSKAKAELLEATTEKVSLEASQKISRQVAHDIRSPLTVLEHFMAKVKNTLPEAETKLGMMSFRRMEDIINNLSSKNVKRKNKDKRILLSALLQEIVSEKRFEYASAKISIELEHQENSYGIFSQIDSSKLKRTISNLINNAIEATKKGTVIVRYGIEDSKVFISITDTGKGIPEEIHSQLFDQGFSQGKKNGSGIGLSFAREFMNDIGGTISFESEEGKTTFTLNFEACDKPQWFVKSVNIPKGMIVIIDDDTSILGFWRERLCRYVETKEDLLYFSNSSDFQKWYLTGHSSDNLYIWDFEFNNQKKNGLESIIELGIQKNSILSTSHYEDDKIREICINENISMLPKYGANHVPIIKFKESPSKGKYLMVDDDEVYLAGCQMFFESKGLELVCFSRPQELMDFLDVTEYQHIIYIDLNILGERDGLGVATSIHLLHDEKHELIINTGDESFSHVEYDILAGSCLKGNVDNLLEYHSIEEIL